MTEQPPTLADLTGQPTPRRRPRWPWIAAAAAVAAAGLIGLGYALGQDDPPAPVAASATSAAPTPTGTPTDWTREGCTRLSALDTPADPVEAWTAGQAAAGSPDPAVAAAGEVLRDAADAPDATVPGDGPIAIAQAQIDLAEACSAVYGDGNW